MPDIIDLLSSPSIPALDPACPPSSPLVLPPSRPQRPTAAPGPTPGKAAATRLGHGVVDLTADSPLPAPSTTSAPATAGNQDRRSRLEASGVTPGGLFLLSDDFDTTGDLNFSVVAATPGPAERAAKRARLSPGQAFRDGTSLRKTGADGGKGAAVRLGGGRSHSTGAGKLLARPGVLQPSGVRRWNPAVDPIQHSSSPESARAAPGRSNATSAAAHLRSRMHSYAGFHDPFASSSSPPQAAAAAATTGLKESDYTRVNKASISAAEGSKGKACAAPSMLSLLDDFDDPFASPNAIRSVPTPVVAQKKQHKSTAAWDPIISSSAPEEIVPPSRTAGVSAASPHRPRPKAGMERSRSEVIDILDSSEGEGGGSSRRPGSAANLASDDSLPDVEDLDFSKIRSERPSTTMRKAGQRKDATAGGAAPPRVTTTKSNRTAGSSSAAAAQSAAEKAEKAAAKEAEKERKKLERERMRAEKTAEKVRAAALAEINKARTDKKHSTPEMIVDLAAGFNPTTKVQVEALLHELEVECTTINQGEGPRHPIADSVVMWRRKVRSRYDEELGHWVPTSPYIEEEEHVLVLLPAAELVNLALGRGKSVAGDAADGQQEGGGTLDDHVEQMRALFPGRKLIYLVEGFLLWMRKNRNLRNRQFAAAVRGLAESGPAAAPAPDRAGRAAGGSRGRKNAAPPEHVDEEAVEDALLSLQVVHGALIHHTAVPVESAQWIVAFTQHISTIPYKRTRERANDAGAAFCMDAGQVRTGDGAADTYARMLQEIVRVTAPIAHGVANRHTTVSRLVRALEAAGPLALEAVPRSANRDGEPSDRAVGQAVSRRMHKVFTGRDPGSTDV